jgi:hypothetical protein
LLPVVVLLLSLTAMTPGLTAAVTPRPALVPTHVVSPAGPSLSAGSGAVAQVAPPFRGHPPPAETAYDEQLGMTFTQDFSSMEYNVTAVEQVDPTLGTGPGYLLSGVSTTGYWYQVGLSWDWSVGTGFQMSYEVFDSLGNSIFPSNGGGGLAPFTGTVNAGDTVTLNLYFNGSGQVVLLAMDTTTGASAQEVYSAVGSTYFVGQPTGDSNSNGYFTGLMTEFYHGAPSYSNVQQVIYRSNFSLSSAWLWMDEFNANTLQIVFATNSSSLDTFNSNPFLLQGLTYGSITEYCDAREFITGPQLNSTTTTSSSSSSASTVTETSTQVITTTVPVTVTQTSTATATVTQAVTTTVTSTQPVTVTYTSTSTATSTATATSTLPASTSTTTQTVTQTATALTSLPVWSYALMAVLLLAGLGLGYTLKQPHEGPAGPGATPQSTG